MEDREACSVVCVVSGMVWHRQNASHTRPHNNTWWQAWGKAGKGARGCVKQRVGRCGQKGANGEGREGKRWQVKEAKKR